MTPIVDLNAKSAPAPAKASSQAAGSRNNELIFGGGALALLALAAAAYAMSRRRRREEVWVEEPTTQVEPMDAPVATTEPVIHHEEPAVIAPSAFAWGPGQPATQGSQADSDDDRMPGETWVERARRGPSPGNPSVSLKNRLRRAAFFDKRERDVAAGVAEPVEMDAGLPDATIEEHEREHA